MANDYKAWNRELSSMLDPHGEALAIARTAICAMAHLRVRFRDPKYTASHNQQARDSDASRIGLTFARELVGFAQLRLRRLRGVRLSNTLAIWLFDVLDCYTNQLVAEVVCQSCPHCIDESDHSLYHWDRITDAQRRNVEHRLQPETLVCDILDEFYFQAMYRLLALSCKQLIFVGIHVGAAHNRIGRSSNSDSANFMFERSIPSEVRTRVDTIFNECDTLEASLHCDPDAIDEAREKWSQERLEEYSISARVGPVLFTTPASWSKTHPRIVEHLSKEDWPIPLEEPQGWNSLVEGIDFVVAFRCVAIYGQETSLCARMLRRLSTIVTLYRIARRNPTDNPAMLDDLSSTAADCNLLPVCIERPRSFSRNSKAGEVPLDDDLPPQEVTEFSVAVSPFLGQDDLRLFDGNAVGEALVSVNVIGDKSGIGNALDLYESALVLWQTRHISNEDIADHWSVLALWQCLEVLATRESKSKFILNDLLPYVRKRKIPNFERKWEPLIRNVHMARNRFVHEGELTGAKFNLCELFWLASYCLRDELDRLRKLQPAPES